VFSNRLVRDAACFVHMFLILTKSCNKEVSFTWGFLLSDFHPVIQTLKKKSIS
jgi:hypothetical protein